MADENDAPARIWLEPACVPGGERCWSEDHPGDCCEDGCEMPAIEYIRADLVPQPPQEPTDAEVEAAARAICAEQSAFMGEPACWAVKGADGCELPWPNPGCNEPGCHAVARAALIAARKARA